MSHRSQLNEIARRSMREHGLEPDIPPEANAQADRLHTPSIDGIRDLRSAPWTSMDNESSRDLDQLEHCERSGTAIRLWIAIADVAALVARDTPIDDHARTNTTSVYTPGHVFPMLPLKLSTDTTSLNPGEDRLAVVIDMEVGSDGALVRSDVYRAVVRSHAKLEYERIAEWLNGRGDPPPELAETPGLDAQIRLQDELASRLRSRREEQGALDFDRTEAVPVLDHGEVTDLREVRADRARDIIEDFMIAANTATAGFLAAQGRPALRRLVRTPARWPRIVRLAREAGDVLPAEPDARALESFLTRQRQSDPDGFSDLSLSIIKLMGSGEYVVADPSHHEEGHFALALSHYTHSTAPNRRFPDLVTQRQLKSILSGAAPAYSLDELRSLASHCTRQEDAAAKVERQVRKAAAALLFSSRVGDTFPAVVTGASSKGTWVRTRRPSIEGKVVAGSDGLDVGDQVRVRLVETDAERGFIDFVVA